VVTDKELVQKAQRENTAAKAELWSRYQNLVHKNWFILREQMQNSIFVRDIKEDFYMEAYIALEKALHAVNLEKIYDDKWKFLGYYRLYLKNVRTELIKKIRDRAREKPLFVETDSSESCQTDLSPLLIEESAHRDDPQEIYIQVEGADRVRKAVAYCKNELWDEKRRTIFDLRAKGILKQDIALKLGIAAPTLTYYLNQMREDLEDALEI
jgi:hypothetical protein